MKNLIIIFLLLTFGCGETFYYVKGPQKVLYYEDGKDVKQMISGDLSIGLLADSQFQTLSPPAIRDLSAMNDSSADSFVKVAIRPPAQNILIGKALQTIYGKISQKSPSFFLYLGDGLNNGCQDELDSFLSVVRTFDEPIFLAIGNHDYLGTGNYSNTDLKKKLCAGSKALNKKEVIEVFHAENLRAFQKLVNKDPDWTIYSNIDESVFKCSDNAPSLQDTEKECYMSYVLYNKRLKLSLVILDTSNYYLVNNKNYLNMRVNQEISCLDSMLDIGVSGVTGFVGFEGGTSQIKWIQSKLSLLESHKSRIFAAHYDPESWVVVSDKVSRLGDIMLSSSLEGDEKYVVDNLYLSAHHHSPSMKKPDVYSINKKYYTNISVGSTTDFGNYGALVSLKGGAGITYEPIYLVSLDKNQCNAFENKIKMYLDNEKNYENCFDSICYDVEDNLGLTCSYKNFLNKELSCVNNNILKFINTLNENDKLCFMSYVSEMEVRDCDGLIDRRLDTESP